MPFALQKIAFGDSQNRVKNPSGKARERGNATRTKRTMSVFERSATLYKGFLAGFF